MTTYYFLRAGSLPGNMAITLGDSAVVLFSVGPEPASSLSTDAGLTCSVI